MKGTRAIAVFCEDIREEKSGQDTIIGILPDNMAAAQFPAVAPKLGIYIRVHLDPKSPPNEITVQFKTPWGEVVDVGRADKALIDSAVSQAMEKQLPLAGLVLKALIAPFLMQTVGLAVATISVNGGKESVCAMLNLSEGKPPDSSTLPQPHS
jgi:Family of unknown function (DUF6941)